MGLRIQWHPHHHFLQAGASMTEQGAFLGETYLIQASESPLGYPSWWVTMSEDRILLSLRTGECLDPESSALSSGRSSFQKECPHPIHPIRQHWHKFVFHRHELFDLHHNLGSLRSLCRLGSQSQEGYLTGAIVSDLNLRLGLFLLPLMPLLTLDPCCVPGEMGNFGHSYLTSLCSSPGPKLFSWMGCCTENPSLILSFSSHQTLIPTHPPY